MAVFAFSAVFWPMIRLYFRRIYLMIASSKWVPASFTERIAETPPKDTTAMSVVPPPISTTKEP